MDDNKGVGQNNKIGYSDLRARLAELDARAFQRAERACRMSADPTPDIIYSSNFRARLAAEALGVDFKDVMSLDLSAYTAIINHVLNFLLQNLGEEIQGKN